MALIIAIADAVTAALNTPTAFSLPFTAQRLYRPVFDLQEMKTLHVTVVPRGMVLATAGRSVHQEDYRIDVGVQKKFDAPEGSSLIQQELDALMDLVQQIADFLRRRTLHAGGIEAAWIKTENLPIYAPDHLEQLRQFTSVLTLTYRVLRRES